ncbi:DUF4232 domain-containing protein [Nocardia sp. NPDC051570]|uniref:DUF4232 domain-containing protein n=1 Tax=Nocardia sp. NPDC051570 TaxID=3364324 RepID=UPI0037B93C3B
MPSSARYSAVGLGAIALTVAACGGDGPDSGGTTTPPLPALSAPLSSLPSPGSAMTPQQSTTGPTSCATGQLSVTQQDQGVGAGQRYAALIFTNTSTTPCTLTGYPGVSYVADSGDQSGNPADRASGPITTVTLIPGAQASALLHDTNGMGGYDPDRCQLAPAAGLRVYPPDQRDSVVVPGQTSHCAGPDIHSFTVGPIQPGPLPTR